MSTLTKLGMLAAVWVVVAAGASASQAAPWRYSTSSSRLNATGSAVKLNTPGGALTCSGSSVVFNGPATPGTYAGPDVSMPWVHVADPATAVQTTFRFTGCTLGSTTYTVVCNGDETPAVAGAYLNAMSTTAVSSTDGATYVRFSSIACKVYVGAGTATFCANIASAGANVASGMDRVGLAASYANPRTVTGTGTVTIDLAGTALISNTSGSGCVLGNGTVTFTDTSGLSPVYTVASMSLWVETWRYSTTSSALSATGPAVNWTTGGSALTCSGSSALLRGPTAGMYTGAMYPGTWTHVGDPSRPTDIQITLRFTGCRVGGNPYTIVCNGDEAPPVAGAYLNALTTTSTSALGGSTTVNLSTLGCNVYLPGSVLCTRIASTGANVNSGTDRVGVTGTYANPTTAGGTGTLAINATGMTLASSPGGSGCVLGSGTVRFTNATGGNPVFTVAASMSLWGT